MKYQLCIFILAAGILSCRQGPVKTVAPHELPAIAVSNNNHFLTNREGEPFFWLGDTGWELFHRLDRKEAATYIQTRKSQGFNVIQAVVLYELQTFDSPNAYGDFPLKNKNIGMPDTTDGDNPADSTAYDYWDHVEYIIKTAAENDMVMAVLPCWGEYVTPRFREPTINDSLEGYKYGHFIGNRLKKYNPHIVWVLGGDRLPDERPNGIEIWRAMAEGITDAISGKNDFNNSSEYYNTFMTYHSYRTSATWFHNDPWIDMHMWGSYHEKRNNERAYTEPVEDWFLPGPKPTLNAEPAYEQLPINYDWKDASNGYFDAFDVRQAAYWSVFSGACGHTYGAHPVWQMYKEENPHPPLTLTVKSEWKEALELPGAEQMKHLKQLMLSRPYFGREPNPEVIADSTNNPAGHLTATRGDGYIMVYAPTGEKVKLHLSEIPFEEVNVWFYNPKTGEAEKSNSEIDKEMLLSDPPGEEKRGNDWVIVVDDAKREFPKPGTTAG